MSMSFRNSLLTIEFKCQTVWLKVRFSSSKSHGSSHLFFVTFWHKHYEFVRCVFLELFRMSTFKVADVSSIFNDSSLHTKTNSKEGLIGFPTVLYSSNFSFHPSKSKPTWNYDSIGFFQKGPSFIIFFLVSAI